MIYKIIIIAINRFYLFGKLFYFTLDDLLMLNDCVMDNTLKKSREKFVPRRRNLILNVPLWEL